MSTKYALLRHKALLLLENTKYGEYITEPDQLASFFDEISLEEFIKRVYNKRIAQALQRNKASMKANLRTRWYLSNKIKAHELLYKLLATQDELSRLKGESQAIESSGSDPLLEALNPQEIWSDEADSI